MHEITTTNVEHMVCMKHYSILVPTKNICDSICRTMLFHTVLIDHFPSFISSLLTIFSCLFHHNQPHYFILLQVFRWHQQKQEEERQLAEQASIEHSAIEETLRKKMQERDKKKRKVKETLVKYHQAQALKQLEEEALYEQRMKEWTIELDKQGRQNKERSACVRL